MKNDFVTYEQALALKELGFNEPCFGVFQTQENNRLVIQYFQKSSLKVATHLLPAPTFSQCFKWFREKHNIDYSIYRPYTKNKYYCWNVTNREIGLEYPNKMVGEYTKTYEEAESACLDKLIEIVKNKYYEK